MRGVEAKRILVAGGAGVLGSYLCQRLLDDGHDVTLPLFVEVDEIHTLAGPESPMLQASTSDVYGDPALHPLAEEYWGVEGFVRMMATDAAVTGPTNLGNPGEFSMRELAEMVVELTGSSSKLDYRPLPQDDPRQRKPDITRANATLGWEPAVALRDGLQKTIDYFDNHLRC